jgi:hypothetical protein
VIVVGSSVWIDCFADRPVRHVQTLAALLDRQAALYLVDLIETAVRVSGRSCRTFPDQWARREVFQDACSRTRQASFPASSPGIYGRNSHQ